MWGAHEFLGPPPTQRVYNLWAFLVKKVRCHNIRRQCAKFGKNRPVTF